MAQVAAGYKAKILCSILFVSGRNVDLERAPEVSADSYKIPRLFRATVDRDAGTVTVSFFGLFPRTAAYRPGRGCTLK